MFHLSLLIVVLPTISFGKVPSAVFVSLLVGRGTYPWGLPVGQHQDRICDATRTDRIALSLSPSSHSSKSSSPRIDDEFENQNDLPTLTTNPVVLDDDQRTSYKNDGETSHLSSPFNPFRPANEQRTPILSQVTTHRISLRQSEMQRIVNELLNAIAVQEQMSASNMVKSILEENAEFLLEPLEDDQAVLEPDSICTSSMSREERYQAYEISMEERISKARKPATKDVLTALRDFVLSHR